MKICQGCGSEYSAPVCPVCGQSEPGTGNLSGLVDSGSASGSRASPKWMIPFLVAGSALFTFFVFSVLKLGFGGLTGPTQDAFAPSAEFPPVSQVNPDSSFVQAEPFEIKLSAGNYTGGIDLPVGLYDITALLGSGNVISSEGLNQMMGIDQDAPYVQACRNVRIEKGTELRISGSVVLRLCSDQAQVSALIPRENELTERITLPSGEYTAGSDFPAGVYDIFYVSGCGNVIASNGVNELFGLSAFRHITSFYNAVLEEGTTLYLNGVTVQLIPSTGIAASP